MISNPQKTEKMKKTYFLLIGAFFILLGAGKVKAQELANYNLYIQNPYLYNTAHSVGSYGMSAFLNTHLQWVGFEDAPQVNSLGVRANIFENSGIGLNVVQNTSGAVKNLMVRVNYGFRAKFDNDHYLRLGTGAGISNDNLSRTNNFTDLTDPVIHNEIFNGTSFSATAGLSYVNKNFEAQFIMPQLFWRKELNHYSIGVFSYNFELNSEWAIKPSFMVRGLNTSPIQYDGNVAATWQNTIWAQAGYRSNSSFIISLGINISSFDLAYAYQMNNADLSHVSNGTHEIQLVYNIGKLKCKPKTVPVSGSVSSAFDGKKLPAQLTFVNTENLERKTETNDEGFFILNLKKQDTYTVNVSADNYYPHSDLISIGEYEVEKKIDYELVPTNTKISGFVLRKGNNKPVVANINVLENGAEISSVQTKQDGSYEFTLKSGKTYEIEVSAENFTSTSEQVEIPEKTIKKNVNFELEGLVKLNGAIFSNESNNEISSIIEIQKEGSVVETINSNGKYQIYLKQGDYLLTVKAADHITKKVSVKISPLKEEFVQNISLDKLNKNQTFSLGNIEFKVATAELTGVSFATLDKLVKILSDDKSLNVELAGHTDSDGPAAANMKISQQRAEACVKYIVSKGIDASRLKAKGYGETMPLVPNTTAENKAKNRRVEFKFID